MYHNRTNSNVYIGVGIIIEMKRNMKATYKKVTNQIIRAGNMQ